jgi:hypothetical protein
MHQHWHPAAHPARAAREILKLAEHTDVYVGVTPRRHRHGGRSAIHRAWVLWADLDQPDGTHPGAGVPVAPGVIIYSGTPGHRHLYWPLIQPLSVAQVERANGILALALRADSGAVLNAATILRPPGTHNFKHGRPSTVTLERFEPRAHTATQILDGLPGNVPAPPHAEAVRIAASDPLLAIEPACYVQSLTGLRVPRSRKVSCPFHELSGRRAVGDGVSPAGSVADASVNDRGDGRVSVEGMDAQLPREAAEGASTSPAGLARSPRACSLVASSDPLRSVPPPVYFERLTGLRVGPSGKLRCLFHDDRSPSLHVYREPGRGWYCFGCGRGGSIYDLAALLSGRGTRGLDFAKLRRELEELMR